MYCKKDMSVYYKFWYIIFINALLNVDKIYLIHVLVFIQTFSFNNTIFMNKIESDGWTEKYPNEMLNMYLDVL